MSMMQAWFGSAGGVPNVPGVFAWGSNNKYGQFGNGSTYYNSKWTPVQSFATTDWLQVSAGAYHTLGIRSNGTLWAWGTNATGQLGLNNTTNYQSPKQIGALTSWASCCAAAQTSPTNGASFAIKNDGTLWSWGLNNFGQLGLGNTTSYSSPKQVGALTTWQQISCYGTTAAGRGSGGVFYTWGRNNYGQLGDGTTNNRSSPAYVAVGIGKVYNVSCAGYHILANRGIGIIYAWGKGANGALGLGNTTNYSTPKLVSNSGFNWGYCATTDGQSSGSGGAYGASANVKKDGTLWVWGQNRFSTLGTGNNTKYSSPKQIGALTNWKSISMSSACSVAIKKDGTMWGVGFGFSSGTGKTISSFSQILVNSKWQSVSCSNYGKWSLAINGA